MTIQPASLMLMKIGDGQNPENFITIGGLQNAQLDIQHDYPENNTLESGRWNQVNASAGFSRIGIAGEGVFTDSSGESTLLGHALNHSAANYEFHFANSDKISGQFVITDYRRLGHIEEEEIFNITLINSGEVVFAASA